MKASALFIHGWKKFTWLELVSKRDFSLLFIDAILRFFLFLFYYSDVSSSSLLLCCSLLSSLSKKRKNYRFFSLDENSAKRGKFFAFSFQYDQFRLVNIFLLLECLNHCRFSLIHSRVVATYGHIFTLTLCLFGYYCVCFKNF